MFTHPPNCPPVYPPFRAPRQGDESVSILKGTETPNPAEANPSESFDWVLGLPSANFGSASRSWHGRVGTLNCLLFGAVVVSISPRDHELIKNLDVSD